MPRPSQNLDVALLQAGRELFPRAGCAGLSVRAVAEQAGANLGMFHYHFKTKDNFLRTLLQQVYEEMYAGLSGAVSQQGPAVERLRAALVAAAALLVTHRKVFARVWMDAIAGEPVATEFMQHNAPRHIGLLFGLVQQAQAEGALRALPPFQCVATLLGAVALPIVFASGLVEVAMPAAAVQRQFRDQVMSPDAIAQRVDLALAALRAPVAPAGSRRRRAPSRH
ncbi:TetR/AcrR family transcriptional regulator [Piscinibacter sp. XHJ-5]|uniref:TetR/AcrR family transcriptional regulator n=1 Tax=Piscinibacter sp. XHJ-5 TaxID=3037797 RepID=UPI00245291A2|nr:TetR/AcrR family transcriptional regulator [Piscinibacter sp. XHJ-5]